MMTWARSAHFSVPVLSFALLLNCTILFPLLYLYVCVTVRQCIIGMFPSHFSSRSFARLMRGSDTTRHAVFRCSAAQRASSVGIWHWIVLPTIQVHMKRPVRAFSDMDMLCLCFCCAQVCSRCSGPSASWCWRPRGARRKTSGSIARIAARPARRRSSDSPFSPLSSGSASRYPFVQYTFPDTLSCSARSMLLSSPAACLQLHLLCWFIVLSCVQYLYELW